MRNVIVTVLVVVVLVAAALAIFYKSFIPKTAYVNIDQVYNNFPLKSELEKKLTSTHKEREKILDSLRTELNSIGMNIDAGKLKKQEDINLFYLKRENLNQKEKQFNEDTDAQTAEYKNQIWKQLNQYIKDYGKENGYEYIFGVDEGYVVLYKDEKRNITDELSRYVNDKFKGTIK